VKRKLILLAILVVLYLGPSLILQGVYGDSFGFLSGENCWKPDGYGGWREHGHPTDPMPVEPSVNVPLLLLYLPILLPGLLLATILLTPLSRKLDDPTGSQAEEEADTGTTAQSDS